MKNNSRTMSKGLLVIEAYPLSVYPGFLVRTEQFYHIRKQTSISKPRCCSIDYLLGLQAGEE